MTKTKVDTLLNRSKIRYCYSIIMWEHNSLKEEVLRNSRAIRTGKSVQQPTVSTSFTDRQIMNYISDKGRHATDIVVNTEWMQVTRAHMQTLLPGRWLYDTVIDLAGLCATHLKPEVLYVPTTLRVSNAVQILSRKDGFVKLKEISLFSYVNMNVQYQNNGYDCGIYVIKWIEALMDESLWNNKKYFMVGILTFAKFMRLVLGRFSHWIPEKLNQGKVLHICLKDEIVVNIDSILTKFLHFILYVAGSLVPLELLKDNDIYLS
ncbi:hypothetical protein RND81_05G001700 [Saponaria officinalis]|uniref:Ubiquitin-like protease family profile domain-containing protein n=1 Tax=Saponaria officinalis TaxID=3572 RepID=A0AAW1KVY2_SAPOF